MNLKMKKFYPILPLVWVFMLFSCQPKAFNKIEEIPVPPGAQKSTIEGRYEVGLDAAIDSIVSELKQTHAETPEKIMFLPPETEASAIFDFYAPKFTEKGFTKDADIPRQGRNFQRNVWRKGAETVSIAVIDAGTDAAGKPIKFLAIHMGVK